MKARFEKRDFVALALIPFVFLFGWLISFTPLENYNATLNKVVMIVVRLGAVVPILVLYRDILITQWRTYRKKLWLKILISIAAVPLIHLLLYAVRLFLPAVSSVSSSSADDGELSSSAGFMLAAAMVALTAPFLEEVIFRHVLFYKFRAKKLLCILMFLLSAVLFGAIHLNNFGGHWILVVPYMFLGAFFALVYLFTKNIWYPIGMHFFFNMAGSLLPALFVMFMQKFIM